MAEGTTVRALLLSGAANAGTQSRDVRMIRESNFFIGNILPEFLDALTRPSVYSCSPAHHSLSSTPSVDGDEPASGVPANHALEDGQVRERIAAVRANIVRVAFPLAFLQVVQRILVEHRMNRLHFQRIREGPNRRRRLLPLGFLEELRIHDVALVGFAFDR